MISKNYLFGPFIGEATYELNYFVGHAIYLRKQNPKNKIIVFTRREHFDLYGKYATTFLPLQLDDDLISEKFGCKNIRPHFYDELNRQFSQKYKNKIKICDHFYPMIMTQLRNNKWYYPRDEIDFDFKTRSENKVLVDDITINYENIIFSTFNDSLRKFEKHLVFPVSYISKLNLEKRNDISVLGLIIEMIRISEYVYADIDHVVGRLAMLLHKPLITKRKVLDAQYLNPINPYGSIVIGCENLEEGIKYLEVNYEQVPNNRLRRM